MHPWLPSVQLPCGASYKAELCVHSPFAGHRRGCDGYPGESKRLGYCSKYIRGKPNRKISFGLSLKSWHVLPRFTYTDASNGVIRNIEFFGQSDMWFIRCSDIRN